MHTLTPKTVLFATLAAVATLPLTACVAPYGPSGAQPGYPGQYPTQGYAQPDYAQPAYAQPGYVQPAYPSNQTQPYYGYNNQSSGQYAPYTQYGTVVNIQPIDNNATGPSGVAGTVVGALIGGVLGNQFGRGHGRDAATVIGALGGAVAGNQIGQQMGMNNGQAASYRVDVQVRDGSTRSFDVQSPGSLRPGDRVRIDGNQLSAY